MDISALVLAGGKSSRMNGNNKAFLSYNNKSFLENIIDALEDIDNIYISVDNKEKYKDLKFPLIEDEYKDIGPIGGMYSAFKKIDSDFIIVIACDMPLISKDFIKFLKEYIRKEDSCLIIEDSENRLYPLGGIYNKKILPIIEDMIKKNDYKLMNLIKNVKGRTISLKDKKLDKSLVNVNDPKEYNKLNNIK
ncbi:molybdopterin-guanine dinucleotide biosynthesis protein A [Clostridium sp. DSM 8431]|uniref:molybdenum cofactor guanylyltransferase n=1 Tax=Clostridium sp. DSM 8431 TaxID=1761781 RepID=UPI0008E14ACE|nr:molybdenum cofactor guanylyltransferase [Clostridium sp. DSM 8431]SFU57405.1 molybdopterin-guanine dinucleotide biosynthesis protein A [Clostridium sp. DSM 8431]